jgi:predicted nucleotidyltransferase
VENPPGRIILENGGRPITTIGFIKALENSIEVQTGDGFKFKVASIPGLVLLKLVAFYDRPPERDRDIQDIWFVLKRYFDIGNEDRLYDEHVDLFEERDFDLERAAARMLGRDVAQLLADETKSIILDTLSEEEPDEGLNRMVKVIRNLENRLDDISEKVKAILRSFRRGLTEERPVS